MNSALSHIADAGSKGAEVVDGLASTANAAGYSSPDIGVFVGGVLGVILGLMGVIFLGMIVFGGFMWLTSDGEEKKIEAARNMITQAVIGLIVTSAAYVITVFVVNALHGAGGFSAT